jgi:hypothetical protein
LTLALSCVAVAWGWALRDQLDLTPRTGAGYVLGIVGNSCMVLLLLYSLRKRLRGMAGWGAIRHWFGIHMLLGILGPVAIVFHSNFQLGSVNSTVALACSLVVAASGVVGKMIYPKVHHGLHGVRTTLEELRRDVESQRSLLGAAVAASPRLTRRLRSLEAIALAPRGALLSLLALPRVRRAARRTYAEGVRLLDPRIPRRDLQQTQRALRDYVSALHRVAEFRCYARIFSLWHAFHLPLCIMLFAAAAVHVVAVHMY